MAGRGRGQSRTKMLEAMGVEKSEMPQRKPGTDCLTPSPLFPVLPFKPVPLPEQTDKETRELMMLKIYVERSGNSSSKRPLKDTDFRWNQFPRELWPDHLRNPAKKNKNNKRKVQFASDNINGKRIRLDGETEEEMKKRLDNWEKNELEEGGKERGGDGEEEEEGGGDENTEVGAEEEPDEDEEMDDGTDYANDYFDNGEDYAPDEDDGLDDGAYY